MLKNIHFTFKRYEGIWKDGVKMGMEQKLSLMEESMLGNTRRGNKMVKGHTITLVEKSMLGNGRMGTLGILLDTTKKEILLEKS